MPKIKSTEKVTSHNKFFKEGFKISYTCECGIEVELYTDEEKPKKVYKCWNCMNKEKE